jgi:hypothetical protein
MEGLPKFGFGCMLASVAIAGISQEAGVSRKSDETLYDKTIQRLKNNPIIVTIMVLGVVIIAIAQFLNASKPFLPTKQHVTELQVTIQPYNVVTGYTDSPAIRSLDMGNTSETDAIAKSIIEQVIEVVQPNSSSGFNANLEIKGNVLSSDQSLEGGVVVVNSFTQVAARVKIPDLAKGEDLTQLFSDPATFDEQCNCIYLELYAPKAGFENLAVKIHRDGDAFSFDSSSQVTKKALRFTVVTVSILIEYPKGEGADAAKLSAFEAGLNNGLRQNISGIESLRLSPYQSLSDLRAVIDPLIPSISPGEGKGNVLEQYRVDFIITVNFVLK